MPSKYEKGEVEDAIYEWIKHVDHEDGPIQVDTHRALNIVHESARRDPADHWVFESLVRGLPHLPNMSSDFNVEIIDARAVHEENERSESNDIAFRF